MPTDEDDGWRARIRQLLLQFQAADTGELQIEHQAGGGIGLLGLQVFRGGSEGGNRKPG